MKKRVLLVLITKTILKILILGGLLSCDSDNEVEVQNIASVASFTAPATAYVGQEIQFIDESSDSDGNIVEWNWDFGDGGMSVEQNPVYTYSNEGDFEVTLTVFDDGGLTAGLTQTLKVEQENEEGSLTSLTSSGRDPFGNLIESNGRLWGMTFNGGTSNHGAIFNLNIDGSDYQEVHHFNGTDGSNPQGSLFESGGKLWGMTYFGGTSNYGVVFSINTDGTGYRKIVDFNGANGGNPRGNLIESNNKLWGITSEGGSGRGVIFTLDLNGSNFTKVHDFVMSSGYIPYGSLMEANGRLWGTTRYGGHDDLGTIFSINPDGTDYKKCHDFGLNTEDGGYPEGNLIAQDNKLWGTAGSILYSINEEGEEYTIMSDRLGFVRGSLIVHEDKFWGLDQLSGANGDGMVFSINGDGTDLTVIHEFNEASDQSNWPFGDLLVVNGKLWGMTSGMVDSFYGIDYRGMIFSINTDGSDYEIVHSF